MSTHATVGAVLALQKQPHSSVTLASDLRISRDGARRLMHRFKEAGYLEFTGWAPRGEKGATPAMYVWKEKT